MKHPHYSVFFLALGLLLTSCTESIEQPTTPKLSYIEHRELLTKAAKDQLTRAVTRTDVEDYLSLRMHVSAADMKDITRFDIEQDAYIYIVNLEQGGWYLCSGDYSSAPVIAYSETGSLSFNGKLSRHTQGWLQSIREQIVGNRNSNSEAVQANRDRWIHSKRVSLTRSDPVDTEVDIVVITDTLKNEYYGGLTNTTWEQIYPFNLALPKRHDDESIRCIAGCAVAAIAQLVYYTHYAFGFPNDIYASAYCNDYYDDGPPYSFVFSNLSSSTWDDMPLKYNLNDYGTAGWPAVSALYALIADRSNTRYTPYYGETSISVIPSVLNSFLLSGVSNQSYNRDEVLNEITNDRPVLCSGFSAQDNTIGHCFLFDGYSWKILRETYLTYDMEGNLIDQNSITHNMFQWRVNSSDDGSYWVFDNYYYPHNRIMHIGWTQ